jgi:hypothetical protein
LSAIDLGEDRPQYGPKMAMLPLKRRAFVEALFDEHCPVKRKAQLIFAAKQAGFGTKTSSAESLATIGRRLETDHRIRDAIEEETRRQNRSIGPAAVTALRKILADPKHRDHGRMIAMVLDRIDPPQTGLNVKIDHQVRHVPIERTEAVLRRMEELASRAGVTLRPPEPKLIEGDCAEVTP